MIPTTLTDLRAKLVQVDKAKRTKFANTFDAMLEMAGKFDPKQEKQPRDIEDIEETTSTEEA